MGWPPAVVIVVRHGARLDAADKQWHLSSPTPYDPPLTYGGFTQSKSLGARIASILRSRETDDEADGYQNGGQEHPDGNTRKRRHKVVIHTSPFLRCVQTSIGIAAGLAQNPGHMHRSTSKSASSAIVSSPSPRGSPKIRPTLATNSPRIRPSSPLAVQIPQQEIKKSTIRVDAFLGEWLSPDYFEHITPPPSSIMMVASAKADLLRREDYSNLAYTSHNPSTASSANKGFPGGWSSPTIDSHEESLFAMSSLRHNLPRRDRTSSLSSSGHNGTGIHGTSPQRPCPSTLVAEHGIYQPPIPSYAISASDPIPQGYVAHARDACVNVDYQWDSMRAPQNWGNGGEYGEEWSSMHKRFRKGLQNLVSWYSEKESPFALGSKTNSRSSSGEKSEEEEDDDDEDLVVILVTHGAGCNALIGALTNHPVLIDVGMASLTMAVRKTVVTPRSTPSASPPESPRLHSRVGAKVQGISDEYDVKLVANTEHLRPSSSSTISRGNSISNGSPNGILGNRYPTTTGNPLDSGITFSQAVNSHRHYISQASSIRRSTSNASPSALRTSFTVTGNNDNNHSHPSWQRSGSIGLWTAPGSTSNTITTTMVVEDEVVLNFGDHDDFAENKENPTSKSEERVKETPPKRPETPKNGMWLGRGGLDGASDSISGEEERDEVKDLASPGLWGSPRPPGEAERLRDLGPHKRRWTVTARNE